MKMKSLWLWIVVLCIGLTACSKDDPQNKKPNPDPNPNPDTVEITLESTSTQFKEGETTQILTFEANRSWTASILDTKESDTSWLSISPQSGDAGKATITISASESYSKAERTAYIHIKVDGLSKSIAVSQVAGIVEIPDDKAGAPIASNGFFVANEDWLGHDDGTINYFKLVGTTYEPAYRVYREANGGDKLGVTTQFATIWGDNTYICSKQGNRFVVADAKTLKSKLVLTNIGGDGRSFVGVDDKKGYISLSGSVVVFDIENLKLGSTIEGISGQIGSICKSGERVFAVSASNGLYVIDTKTDLLEKNIAGSFYTATTSKDGDIWAASSVGLIHIDPETLETETIPYPGGSAIGNTWGAWNAGSLCASTQTNTLYWTSGGGMFGGGKVVIKFDVDTRTATPAFYTLGNSELGTQLEFYGAGLRVDPLTDELILTAKHSGWGDSGSFNWIYKINGNGQEIANFRIMGGGDNLDENYYWFPAVPFFEDANKPQILINQILLEKEEEREIDLTKVIIDYDNSFASIQKTVLFADNDIATGSIKGNILTIKAGDKMGKSTCTITAISNGVRVEKEVRIDIAE